MLIVGLNAYHGDVAAAVLRDGVLVAALEEERFARIKHVAGFPAQAIARGLAMAGASAGRCRHLGDRARPPRALAAQGVVCADPSARRRAGRLSIARPPAKHRDITDVIAREFGLPADQVRGARALHRASSCAPGQRVSHQRARRGGLLRHRWLRRFRQRVDRPRPRLTPGRDRSHLLSAFAGLAVSRHYAASRVSRSTAMNTKSWDWRRTGRRRTPSPIQSLVRLEPGGKFTLDLSCFRHWTGEITMELGLRRTDGSACVTRTL